MMEALRNSRMGMRVLFLLAAMMVALMAASVMLNAPTSSLGGALGAKEADAALTHRDIKGVVVRSDNGQAVPYATAYLYWQDSQGGWHYWKSAKANAYGRFLFTANNTGYKYQVTARGTVNGNSYIGNGSTFYLSPYISGAANSTVRLNIQNPW